MTIIICKTIEIFGVVSSAQLREQHSNRMFRQCNSYRRGNWNQIHSLCTNAVGKGINPLFSNYEFN